MKDTYTQIDLYNKRSQIRTEIKPIRFEKKSKGYIKNLFFSNKKKITILLFLVLGISLIEIMIPLLLNFFLEKFAYQVDFKKFYYAIFIIIFVLVLYVYLSYFAIDRQKRIVLNIINKVRKDWLIFYISKNVSNFKSKDIGNLYVKISYHLSLLQTGLQNSFFVFFQWSIFLFGILIISAILDLRLLIISIILIPVNLIVFFISYLFSSYYLAKDQTLYSKLLRYISDTFHSFSFIKTLKKEKDFIQNVDHIIEIDNYFRIKREIVLNLGNNIIFVVLMLLSVSVYIFHIYIPFNSENIFTSLVFSLVFVLHIKLIYLSLRMGLYYYPLKLGLFLCVPPMHKKESNKINNIGKIRLFARKVRLTQDENYRKKVLFEFEKGKTYIIRDTEGKTRNMIPKIIMGTNPKSQSRNWIIKINDTERSLYSEWMNIDKSLYFINTNMYSEQTLFDFFENTTQFNFLKSYPVFDFIFTNKKFLSVKIDTQNSSFSEMVLYQIAYVLLVKPEIVIVDPLIQDLPYQAIKDALAILKRELHDSIYITSTHVLREEKDHHVTYTI